jgi:hypothetical protein
MTESRSSASWNVMPESDKLYWKDGSSNIVPWKKKSLVKYARLIFPEEIVQVLIKKEIPAEWTTPYAPPLIPPMGEFEIALELKKREEYIKKYEYWNNNKGKLTTFVSLCQQESSQLRVDKYHEFKVDDLVAEGNVTELLKLIETSHTFIGATSGFDDQEAVDLEWGKIEPEENELLEVYTNRYQKLIKKCNEVGLKTKKKKIVYRYLKGLRNYKRSDAVLSRVITYIADVDDDAKFPTDFAEVVDELQRLDQAENSKSTKTTNSNRFAVQSINKETNKKENKNDNAKEFTFPNGETGLKHPDSTFQVYTTVGISKKFKKGSEQYNGLFKPSHVGAKRKFDNNKYPKKQNTHMEAYVKRETKKWPRMSAEEFNNKKKNLYKTTKCRKCEKFGHLEADCTFGGAEPGGVVNSTYGNLPEESQAAKKNTSGFFSCYTTFSKPVSEEHTHYEKLRKSKNMERLNLDSHANINVFMNESLLTNIRKVKPIKVKGFGGMYKYLDTVGDHPLLGEVFLEKDNDFNIISITSMREEHGYFRRISKDNLKEYLYNDDLQSVFTFDLDPADGFYKISLEDFNIEMMRIFPNLCQSIS